MEKNFWNNVLVAAISWIILRIVRTFIPEADINIILDFIIWVVIYSAVLWLFNKVKKA